MSEGTDVNKNPVEENGEITDKGSNMTNAEKDLIVEEAFGEVEPEEEEYQPKKKRAAVKRRLQATAKAKPKKIIKVTENGETPAVKARGPGRPKGSGRPPKGRRGRPTKAATKAKEQELAPPKDELSLTIHFYGDRAENTAPEDEGVVVVTKPRRAAAKKVKSNAYVEPPASETDEDYDYELCEYNGHVMAVKPEVFHAEVVEAVSKWEAEWTRKEEDDVLTTECPLEGCNMKVANRDLEIHGQCHKEDGSGFHCVHKNCIYEHEQWQNVRTHISKSHRSLLEVWKCDQPECNKQFTRWVSLRRHIMYKHIYESTSQILAMQRPITEDHIDKKVKKIRREQDVPPSQRKKPRKPVMASAVKKEKMKKEKVPKESPKNKPLKCNKCLATYKGEDALKEHMERHTQVIYTKCAECDEYFTDDKDLQKHLKDNHGQLLHMHRCSLCSYTSSYVSDLKIHQYTHQDTKFECDCCGQVCANPKTLRSHRMRKHADMYENKNLMCSFCGHSCPNEVLLQDHARDKHHMRLNGAKRINTKEELRFPCNLCDYVGRKQKSLEYHMRLHQEERPFKCNHCNYASKTQNNLKLHLRTHKELAPLKCPHCDFRGATNKVINQHVMSKHTKEKPYQCSVCSWSTCYSGNLWTHMQIHKKKDGIELPERPKSRKRQKVVENVALVEVDTTAAAAAQLAAAASAVSAPISTPQTHAQDLLTTMTTTGLPHSVLSSVGLTTSSVLTSVTPTVGHSVLTSVTPTVGHSVLTSVTPTSGHLPVPVAVNAVSSNLPPSQVTVPVSLNIDFPVIQMAQPLIQAQQQAQVVHQQHQQQADQQQQTHISVQQQTHTDATVHQVQHRYPAQPFTAHIIPPVTSEGFQIGPEPTQAQMVDIQIQDASRRSVVGTIPRQAEDDMETVQQLVNLSNMLPTATSVLHNMQPAYARY